MPHSTDSSILPNIFNSIFIFDAMFVVLQPGILVLHRAVGVAVASAAVIHYLDT